MDSAVYATTITFFVLFLNWVGGYNTIYLFNFLYKSTLTVIVSLTFAIYGMFGSSVFEYFNILNNPKYFRVRKMVI